MIKLKTLLVEQSPMGKVQWAIFNALDQGDTPSLSDWIMLSALARRPEFRGVHFKKIQAAAKALASKGIVQYDGASKIKWTGKGAMYVPTDKKSARYGG